MPAKPTPPSLPEEPAIEESAKSKELELVEEPEKPDAGEDALAATEAANYQQAMADHRPITEVTEGE